MCDAKKNWKTVCDIGVDGASPAMPESEFSLALSHAQPPLFWVSLRNSFSEAVCGIPEAGWAEAVPVVPLRPWPVIAAKANSESVRASASVGIFWAR